MSPKAQLEQEKKIRREIANSNERRRMQSINAGFQSLKTLLPHHGGEKLSKAAILQQTSEYIASLERDKTTVMAENDRLRQQLMNVSNTLNTINAAVAAEESPPPKRKKRDTESSDEGIGLCEESSQLEEMRKKLVDIQLHFDQEKQLRLKFEDRSKVLEEKLQKLSNHVFDQETVMTLTESDNKPAEPLFNASMSRRNLQTIVEAIRHLEGEQVGPLDESVSVPIAPSSMAVEPPAPPMAHQHSTPNIRSSTLYLAHQNQAAAEDVNKDNSDSTETNDDCKSDAGSDLSSRVEEDNNDDNVDDNRVREDLSSELMRPVDFSTRASYNSSINSSTDKHAPSPHPLPSHLLSYSSTLSSVSSSSTSSSSLSSSSCIEQRVAQQALPSDCPPSSVVKANPSSCYKDNFMLLHRPPQSYVNQMYRRPGVIVHKS